MFNLHEWEWFMMKRGLAVVLVFAFWLFVAACVPAVADDVRDFNKWSELTSRAGDPSADQNGYNPAAGNSSSAPANPVEPTPPSDDEAVSTSKLYYCVVGEDKLPNIEELCKKHNAEMKIYRHFKQLLVLKKAGVVVTLNPKNTALIHELRRYYCARPIKETSLVIRVHVKRGLGPIVIFEKEASKFSNGAFDQNDAILQKIVKEPYGYHSTLFKYTGKNFKGLLESVMQKKNGRKYLYNPDVYIELIAVDMNGKGHNVTMFYDEYHYETLSYSVQTSW
jgi:hypothetical protein